MPETEAAVSNAFTAEERAVIAQALQAAQRADGADDAQDADKALRHLRQAEPFLDAEDVRVAIAALGALLAEESSSALDQPTDAARRDLLAGAARKLTRLRMAQIQSEAPVSGR